MPTLLAREHVGVQAGQILAAAVFLPLAYYLPTEAFNSWGWRVPSLWATISRVSHFMISDGWMVKALVPIQRWAPPIRCWWCASGPSRGPRREGRIRRWRRWASSPARCSWWSPF